jgi:Flp pilus assembly protein TadG
MGGNRRRREPSIHRRERGAALIEAAVVTPLLILLTFGIWTTARAWNVHNVLDHAAREAARYGAVDPTHAAIRTVAEGEIVASAIPWTAMTACTSIITSGAASSQTKPVGSGAPTSSGTPCLPAGTGEGQDPTTDDRVQVMLEYPNYTLDFLFWDASITLRARAVARSEP